SNRSSPATRRSPTARRGGHSRAACRSGTQQALQPRSLSERHPAAAIAAQPVGAAPSKPYSRGWSERLRGGDYSAMRAVVVGGVAAVLAAVVAGCHPGPVSPSPSPIVSAPVGAPRRVVPAALVPAPCQQPQGTFRVAGTCLIQVADPKEPELLVLTSDRTFQLSVPALGPSSRQLVQRRGDGIARVGIPVSRPAEVRVSCVGAALCTVSLGDTLSDVSG